MGKYVDCPFCGLRGLGTDEHVWAQWLHETPGAVELLEGTHGERIERANSRLARDAEGRLRAETARSTRIAKWLPNVKVRVCDDCNNGWMSVLEEATKAILWPFIFEGVTHVRLSEDDLLTLATWATKCWMAYALTFPPHQNPFTADEYREMTRSPRPLDRSQTWLMHSVEPFAHVAMSLKTSLMSRGTPDLERAQDNWAYGVLSVGTVVLALQLLPPEATDEMAEALAPPMLAHPNHARRIWPNLRRQYFPLDLLPEGALGALVTYPEQLFEAVGLPTEGLTQGEAEGFYTAFMDGDDSSVLRAGSEQLD